MQLKNFISDNYPRARSTDPITSFEAAESARDLANRHGQTIVECLKNYGAMGKDGISDVTGLEPNQIARRLSELEKEGYIKLTGNTVKSKSNRNEREWAFNYKD